MSTFDANKINIVVIGGYGMVGSQVSTLLARQFSESLVIAGRDAGKAAALASKLGPRIESVAVDVCDESTWDQLFVSRPTVVVCCIELPVTSSLPRTIIDRGISYIELSATYEAHQKLLQCDEIAQKTGAVVPVGVGLMPGLSNIMAADAAGHLQQVDTIAINLMLGLGETHGVDAWAWTIRHMHERYLVTCDGEEKTVSSLSDPYTITLLHEKKPRTFYRFNFSDQHMLVRDLPVKEVISRLAFDSRIMTKLTSLYRKIGILALLKEKYARAIHSVTKKVSVGSQEYALQMAAQGVDNGHAVTYSILATGHKEAQATALVAAYIATIIATEKIKPGVRPVEKIVDAQKLFEYLENEGTRILREKKTHNSKSD